MLAHATTYYSELFGPATEFNIQIDEGIWEGDAHLSEADNEQLCRPFFESEMWAALSQMEKTKQLVLIAFLLSFTKLAGRSLRKLLFNCLMIFTRA